MKKEMNTGTAIIIIIVVLAIVGLVIFKATGSIGKKGVVNLGQSETSKSAPEKKDVDDATKPE